MRVMNVGELKEILKDLSDEDNVVIETIDLKTGNRLELYPFYVDVIDMGIKDWKEIRLVQMTQDNFDIKLEDYV
jgi:hypothetical protein